MTTLAADITLHRLVERHVEGVTALYNEPAVCRQVLQMPYQSTILWRQRMENSGDHHLQLVAELRGAVIGSIGLEQFTRIRRRHAGGIGMGVASEWQGKGVGKMLLKAALEVADKWMRLERIELTVYADNAAAIGLYEKFGFETEGRLRAYAVRDGELVDALTMARLRK